VPDEPEWDGDLVGRASRTEAPISIGGLTDLPTVEAKTKHKQTREGWEMTNWALVSPDHEPPPRRVREQVRDGIASLVCTLGASAGVVVVVALITRLAG